jgi:hypothetical protein
MTSAASTLENMSQHIEFFPSLPSSEQVEIELLPSSSVSPISSVY